MECAERVRAAYANTSPSILCQATDTQIVLEQVNGRTLVIFPGSDSVHDWITNLRLIRLPWIEGKIHAGFRSAFNSIQAALESALPKDEELTICGHSLGGALAMLTADWAEENGYHVGEVYTFGQPRVGNGVFTRAYNEDLADRTWRIVNHRDPVPRVPWFFGIYRHAGTQVYLDRDANIRIDAPLRRAFEDLSAGFSALKNDPAAQLSLFSRIGAHHHIGEYISKLRQGVVA